MTNLIIYLIFNGNCREAMEFYAQGLNGKISFFRTYTDSPLPKTDETSDLIFDSELKSGNIIIKASDSMPEQPMKIGSNFSMFLKFDSFEILKTTFEKLSIDGKVMMELNTSPDGTSFVMFSDKYNIQWMLTHSEK